MNDEIKDKDLIINNRYQIVKFINKGGSGLVYQAVDLQNNNKNVVLKIIDIKDKKQQSSIDSEIVNLNLIKAFEPHKKEHIMDHYENFFLGSFAKNNFQVVFVSEFIEGISLRKYLNKYGAISYIKAVELIKQIAIGLNYLHKNNPEITHQDIKPENCIINETTQKLKIIDVGAARIYYKSNDMSIDNQLNITLAYASPLIMFYQKAVVSQQKKGYILNKDKVLQFRDVSYDIHSLGVMLYEMISGNVPYQKQNDKQTDHQVLMNWFKYDLPFLSLANKSIPKGIDNIILKCCYYLKDIKQVQMGDNDFRYNDIQQLINDLDDVFDENAKINQSYYKSLNQLRFMMNEADELENISINDLKWYSQKWFFWTLTSFVIVLIIIAIICIILKEVGVI